MNLPGEISKDNFETDMKRILYILSITFLLASCLKEKTEPVGNHQEGDLVELTFSVVVPEAVSATKAMGEKPALENLYMAVFDELGYLTQYVEAVPEDGGILADENGKSFNYKVKLSVSDTERIIHWIGNAPTSVRYGSEESVIMAMTSNGTDDMYWARKVVSRISPVDDAEGYAETLRELSGIPLIRNFAKILLADNTDSFELESYTVVNSLDMGYAAAYNFSTGAFVDYAGKTYEELIGEGYDGSTPSISASYIPLSEALKSKAGPGSPVYVYERETPRENPVYIIAYGKFAGADESTYYKINLRDEAGNYFPLFRNFQYTVNLNAVYRNGYATPEEAANAVGSGDVSTAIETASLTYMSDGYASLEVEYTDYVTTSADPIHLGFAFYPDMQNLYSGETGASNPFNASVEILINDDAGAAGAAIGFIGSPVWDAEPYVMVTPTQPQDNPKSQSITVLAKYESGDRQRMLQRKVRYTVMNPQLMEIGDAEVPDVTGSDFRIPLTVPAGLSVGMFPLDIRIESENLSITPDISQNHMSVETSRSITGSGKPAYFFVRTLTYNEYQAQENVNGRKTFHLYFKTTKSASDTEIYAANDFFYGKGVDFEGTEVRKGFATSYLTSYTPLLFNDLTFLPAEIPMGADCPVEFSFKVPATSEDDALAENITVSVTLDNLFPHEEEDGLTLIAGTSDQYEYTVSKQAYESTHTLRLTTANATGSVRVSLSSYHFVQASASAARAE